MTSLTSKKRTQYKPGKSQFALLERLSNAVAVSGNEDEVRNIVLEQIKPLVDDIRIDRMGNLLAVKHARAKNPLRVMLASHMDEVGFMIVAEDGDGLFQFERIGGLDERQLVAKSVLVGKDHLPGIIGAKPIHLAKGDEIHRSVDVDSMRIDVGPANGGKIRTGEYATFATKFIHSGDSLFGKALDNRLGVATLIELAKRAPDSLEILFAFTVQEEIGLRGARVAGFDFNPQIAFAIDCTPAYALPRSDGEENTQYNTRLNAGPAIYISDIGTLSDPRLVQYLAALADKYKIPFQFRQPGGGGTDAAAIHKTRAGVPSVSVSVPGRYAHSPILHVKVKDWENTLALIDIALQNLDHKILSSERP